MDVSALATQPAQPDAVTWAEATEAIAQAVQVIALVGGGIWAFYQFWIHRTAAVSVGIEPTTTLCRNWQPGHAVLLVKLRFANSSRALYQHQESLATLLDARTPTPDGKRVRFLPRDQAKPLAPAYGRLSENIEEILNGGLFEEDESGIQLEPGEQVDSAVAFIIREDELGLMGLRVRMQGQEQRFLRKKDYWWSAFFLIDPGKL